MESMDDPYAFPAVRCTDYVTFSMGLCSRKYTVPMKKPDVPQPEPDEVYMGVMADPRYVSYKLCLLYDIISTDRVKMTDITNF